MTLQTSGCLQLDHQDLDIPDLEVGVNEFAHLLQRGGAPHNHCLIVYSGVEQMYLQGPSWNPTWRPWLKRVASKL